MKTVKDAVKIGLKYFIDSQLSDGSWSGPYSSRIRETLLVNIVSEMFSWNKLNQKSKEWLSKNNDFGFTDLEKQFNEAMCNVFWGKDIELTSASFYSPEILRKTLMVYCLALVKGVKISVPNEYENTRFVYDFLRDYIAHQKHLIKDWARAELYAALVILGAYLGEDMNSNCQTLLKMRMKNAATGIKDNWAANVATTGFALIALKFAKYKLTDTSEQQYMKFIESLIQPDGGWSYFPIPFWGTSLVTLALRYAQLAYPDVYKEEVETALIRAKKYFIKGQNKDGGWPFYPGLESESDTTSIILITFARETGFVDLNAKLKKSDEAVVEKCVKFFKTQQFKSGEYKGLWPVWRKSEIPSIEVVAHVVRALQLLGHSDMTVLAERWLVEKVKEGSWKADWSRNIPYAINAIAWALNVTSLKENIKPLIEHLLKTQNKDGGWGASEGHSSNASATGNAIGCLLSMRPHGKYESDRVKEAVDRGRRFLVDTQLPDGTWPRVVEVLGPRPFHYSDDCSTNAFAMMTLMF